jgi:hypothetical protein
MFDVGLPKSICASEEARVTKEEPKAKLHLV